MRVLLAYSGGLDTSYLVAWLTREQGCEVTTLAVDGGGWTAAEKRSLEKRARTLGAVEHLVLVHCEPGAASAVARALEAEELPGLCGTIAGDDTVLVAVRSRADGDRVRRRVEDLL